MDFHNTVFSQGAKMCRFFMKFRALLGTPKQIMCHNSKSAQPISTKFQDLLNLYERHGVACRGLILSDQVLKISRCILGRCFLPQNGQSNQNVKCFHPQKLLHAYFDMKILQAHLENHVEKLKFHSQAFSRQPRIPNRPTSAGRIQLMYLREM